MYVCVTPVFMSTQSELPVLNFSVELYWTYVPLMFMKVYSVVRVCVVMLISGISNCKANRIDLRIKNTGDS